MGTAQWNGGYGFGTVTVNSAGVIRLAATLADGTKTRRFEKILAERAAGFA